MRVRIDIIESRRGLSPVVGASYTFDKIAVTIGRATSNDLVLLGDSVGRRHALVENKNSELWITDLGSENGIGVAGHPHGWASYPLVGATKVDVGNFSLLIVR